MSGSPTTADTVTDSQLVLLIQQGDTSAFEKLHGRYDQRLRAYIATRCRRKSDVNDVSQEAWLRVWRNVSKFDGRQFSGWLHTIALRLIIDFARRKQPEALTNDDKVADPADNVWQMLAERIAQLQPCVDQLPEKRREIVQARLEGFDFDQISQRLKVEKNTAMTRFHRAKDDLRQCLEQRVS